MFREKMELRFANRGDPQCLVAPRKRGDVVMFIAGPHMCICQIRRIHANTWSRPSEALAALGWKNIVPHAKSVQNALSALWQSLGSQEFDTVEAWDSSFGDQEGEFVVWELRCIEGRYQNIDYIFNNHKSTYIRIQTTNTH
jgi:hypothetical protein